MIEAVADKQGGRRMLESRPKSSRVPYAPATHSICRSSYAIALVDVRRCPNIGPRYLKIIRPLRDFTARDLLSQEDLASNTMLELQQRRR